MRTLKKPDIGVRIILLFTLAGILAALMLLGCNGCKKPVEPTPSVVNIIEQTHNPAIDSLQKITELLTDSITNLNEKLKTQSTKTAIAESKATAASERLKTALKNKDTVEIIVYANDITEEYDNYRAQTIAQDSIQEAIIYKQAAVIENNRAEIQLNESKYNLLKEAHTVQSTYLAQVQMELVKSNKKLKRAKFFNKVLGIGTAAGAVFAGILFL